MRAPACSVSKSETYATKSVAIAAPPTVVACGKHMELICFRFGDLRQLESPGVWTTRSFIRLIAAESKGLTDLHAWPGCFRIGQSRKQGMRDILIRTQKFADQSLPETATATESGSGMRMLSILLLQALSLKYCSKLKSKKFKKWFQHISSN